MSNDSTDAASQPDLAEAAPDSAGSAEPTPAQPLLVLAGADDLVCVDDTCLPPEAAR